MSGTICFADACALTLVVLCADGCAAGDCCAVPRSAMQSSAAITVNATITNAVDLFLSMNFGSPIDELFVLIRCRDPLLSFLDHFFNAGAEILEHDGGAISSWAAGH